MKNLKFIFKKKNKRGKNHLGEKGVNMDRSSDPSFTESIVDIDAFDPVDELPIAAGGVDAAVSSSCADVNSRCGTVSNSVTSQHDCCSDEDALTNCCSKNCGTVHDLDKLHIATRANDPDYPKTTFHLDVAQLLVTNTATTSNDFPCVPSVSDLLLQSGYTSDEERTLSNGNNISNADVLHSRLPSSSSISELSSFTKKDLEREILRLTYASDLLNSSHSSEEDLSSLSLAMERLYISGWYYKNLTRQQVKFMLNDCKPGSFLVRDSTDPGHLFALSVRTPKGTTSVRIEYDNGQFRLDCEDCLRCHMPVFSCIVKLINFYIHISRDENVNNPCVWLETSGSRDMPVRLTQPLRQEPPSLKHLSRLTICSQLPTDLPSVQRKCGLNDSIEQLPLPKPLIKYLKQYPYAY